MAGAIENVFFEECEECLAAAEEGLAAFPAAGTVEAETVNTVFRAVHSIKGGAGAFGFDALVRSAHRFETALDVVREGRVGMSPALVTLLQRARDMLEDHVEAARSGGEARAADDVVAGLDAVIAGEPLGGTAGAPSPPSPGDGSAAPPPGARTLRVAPTAAALAGGGEPLLLLRELVHLGASPPRLDLSRLPPLGALDPRGSYLAWEVDLPEGADAAPFLDVFGFCGDEVAVTLTGGDPPAPEPAAAPPGETAPPRAAAEGDKPAVRRADDEAGPARVVRIDLDRVDRVVNLVGELVITQAMLAERLGVTGRETQAALGELTELTRQLQDGVMAMRAQPIKTVFSRLPKMVRELEAETGKRIVLETRGEATEVDKTVVEKLGEPLTHMIRNAVDHGVETPAERVAAGKPPHGTVRLEAEQRGSRIVITLADDGRGIDRARVLAKAVERGIVAPDAALTEDEIDNLIFAPGFSTAATVSNISGRGVGMDVVRRSVQALGGRVSVASQAGRGATVTLTLPLTLAILEGMIVTVAGATYVIPLGQIVEIIRPRPQALKALGAGRLLLDLRGTYVPVLSVAEALGAGPAPDPTQGVLILVETAREGRAALLVDGIRDQRQIVIKSLDANFGSVPDVAGATILGDGRVALILDVDTMTAAVRDADPALALAA